MNLEFLKIGFKEYLEKNDELGARDLLADDEKNVSIFMHASEFREYLAQEYDMDASFCNKSLSEILNLEIVDGKLVDPNSDEVKNNAEILDTIQQEQLLQQAAVDGENPSEGEEIPADLETSGVEPQEGADNPDEVDSGVTQEYADKNGVDFEDPELITAIINDLLNDDKFKQAIDKDGDGVIGKEDLEAFYDIIKCYDNDENTISLEDLIGAVEDINEGVFRYTTDEQMQETIGEVSPKPSVPVTQSVSSAGYSGGGGWSGSGKVAELPKYDENGKAIVENMSLEELNSELNKANTDLSEKQAAYDEIQNGNDPDLKTLEQSANEAYEALLGQLDKETKDKITAKKDEITAKKEQISAKEGEIAQAETALSAAESSYLNAVSRRQALEGQLSALESKQGEGENADLTERISSLRSEIEKAKQEEDSLKTAKDEAKSALDTLKDQKDKLVNEDLKGLEDDLAEIENSLDSATKEQYLEPYKELQEEYETAKAQKLETAKADLLSAQEYINKIQTAISAKETANEIKEKYPLNDNQAVIDHAYEFLGYSERQVEQATGTSLPDGLWCAAFVHKMLVDTRDSLPGWYENCNYNGCTSILNAAKANGAAFQDSSQAQAGDLVIFRTNRGDAAHIGFVVKIENGKLYTIEGNTSSQVGERVYDLNSSRINSYVRLD